jgi:hypothetical protein
LLFGSFFFQLVKDEFAVGIDKGWDNSSSQFEVDGEYFDNGSEKVSICFL